MSRTVVAIHQPNFFPWLGYFDKLARAGVFCLLDDVQIPKKGGTWSNRVQLAVAGKKAWVTAPIDRGRSGTQTIANTRFRADEPWRRKMLETIRTNYGQAAHFDETIDFIAALVDFPEEDVTSFNEHAIREIGAALNLDMAIVRSSTLQASGHGTALLVAITRELGGTAYMCGGGAGAYQEDDLFESNGVELVEQDFKHPTYVQRAQDAFCPGLSIIDAMMHCGLAETSRLLRGR